MIARGARDDVRRCSDRRVRQRIHDDGSRRRGKTRASRCDGDRVVAISGGDDDHADFHEFGFRRVKIIEVVQLTIGQRYLKLKARRLSPESSAER